MQKYFSVRRYIFFSTQKYFSVRRYIFFSTQKYFSVRRYTFFSTQKYFSVRRYIFLSTQKYFSVRRYIFPVRRNISQYADIYFQYAEIFLSTHIYIFSTQKYFQYAEIFLSTQKYFSVRSPKQIHTKSKEIFLAKEKAPPKLYV